MIFLLAGWVINLSRKKILLAYWKFKDKKIVFEKMIFLVADWKFKEKNIVFKQKNFSLQVGYQRRRIVFSYAIFERPTSN